MTITPSDLKPATIPLETIKSLVRAMKVYILQDMNRITDPILLTALFKLRELCEQVGLHYDSI